MHKVNNWVEFWFNSPHYHDLYSRRNDQDAIDFIESILSFMAPKSPLHALDVCCGNGRHAIALESRGIAAFGVDLSPQNIELAKKRSSYPDRFQVGDARLIHFEQQFDLTTNLFTSFGYFLEDEENCKILKSCISQTAPNGIFVLDFLNTNYVKENLVFHEVISGKLAEYHINRNFDDTWITKKIDFNIGRRAATVEEKVRTISPALLENWLLKMNVDVVDHWGDYKGNPFQTFSPRCIFVLRKK
jgi:SAM-dependent methyltransferase